MPPHPYVVKSIVSTELATKICDANGELTKYNNAAAKYNSYWQGFWNAYNQEHMPRQAATYFKL